MQLSHLNESHAIPTHLVEGELSKNGLKILQLIKNSWPNNSELKKVMGISDDTHVDPNIDIDIDLIPDGYDTFTKSVTEPYAAALYWAMDKLRIKEPPEEYLGYAIQELTSEIV